MYGTLEVGKRKKTNVSMWNLYLHKMDFRKWLRASKNKENTVTSASPIIMDILWMLEARRPTVAGLFCGCW